MMGPPLNSPNLPPIILMQIPFLPCRQCPPIEDIPRVLIIPLNGDSNILLMSHREVIVTGPRRPP